MKRVARSRSCSLARGAARARAGRDERHVVVHGEAERLARADRGRVLRRSQQGDLHHGREQDRAPAPAEARASGSRSRSAARSSRRPGDTFETLAATYLGDPRRGTFLAEFNGLSPDDASRAAPRSDPVHGHAHRRRRPRSIASITAAYFGDTQERGADPRLQLPRAGHDRQGRVDRSSRSSTSGAGVEAAVDRRDAKRVAIASSSRSERAAKALPAAQQAWRARRLRRASRPRSREVELDIDYLDPRRPSRSACCSARLHVASNDDKPALEARSSTCSSASPGSQLDAYSYSPKILAVWKEAGGASRAE